MRSADIARFYLQCDPDEDLSQWPDDRIWKELRIRNAILGIDSQLDEGEILQKGVTAMRSFACEPMRFGQLFLAGDSAHICPPTGAKGMSFVIADVRILARGLMEHYRDGNVELLDRYSEICLRRIWKAQRFSEWMTSLLHRFPGATEYDHRVQTAELEYLLESRNASATLAENYVGLHFEI